MVEHSPQILPREEKAINIMYGSCYIRKENNRSIPKSGMKDSAWFHLQCHALTHSALCPVGFVRALPEQKKQKNCLQPLVTRTTSKGQFSPSERICNLRNYST